MADYIDAGKLFQSTHPARGATNQGRQTLSPPPHFNPRTPRGVRLCVGAQYCPVRPFQSTHPARGATFTSPFLFQVPGNFNPRTPRGVRPGPTATAVVVAAISIHAPREGCDYKREGVPCFDYEISIHAPREGCDDPDFVYTIGETVISIHAPREGCDSKINGVSATTVKFQSTHPARGATRGCYCHAWVAGVFQSTHPARGATPRKNGIFGLPRYFNPRTPRGVRQAGCVFTFPCAYFNPRTPRGVRHVPRWRDIRTLTFQSTHPARGATLGIMRPIRKTPDFNPRTPRGVRLPVAMRIYNHYHFNPRTPRGVRLWNVLTIS